MSITRRLAKLEASAPPPPAPPRALTPAEREALIAAILARLPEDPAAWADEEGRPAEEVGDGA